MATVASVTPSYADGRVVVYDHFLPEREQQEILRYFESARFRKILPDAWGRAYRLANGESLVGQEVISSRRGPEDSTPAYPTKTPLDLAIQRLLACEKELSAVIGSYGDSWAQFTMCPYVYPAACGLGWHTDAHCAGAYIYYAHPKWSPHWGGELLVEYCEEDCVPEGALSRGIVQNEALESALKRGMGYYFRPLPNRLVVLRSCTPHMIVNVHSAAGDNLRLSLSGFFLRTE